MHSAPIASQSKTWFDHDKKSLIHSFLSILFAHLNCFYVYMHKQPSAITPRIKMKLITSYSSESISEDLLEPFKSSKPRHPPYIHLS